MQKKSSYNQRVQTGQTSLTLFSSMMGASMLACPYIVAKLGWACAILAFIITIVSCFVVFYHFALASHYTQASSYRELAEKMINGKLSIILDSCLTVSYFGFMTAYVIISTTNLLRAIHNTFNYQMNPFLLKAIVSLGIILPLCMLKSLTLLTKIISAISIFIFVTAFSIMAYFFIHAKSGWLCLKEDGNYIKYGFNAIPEGSTFQKIVTFLMYLPTLQGNFAIHTVVPTLMKELQGPAVIRKNITLWSIYIALTFACIIYVLVGFMGAATFGKDILDNVLVAYAPCKFMWVNVCSLMYATVVIIAYPLLMYPIKISLINGMKKDPHSKQGVMIGRCISCGFVCASMLVTMFFESIITIFGLFAAITGSVFFFIVPILFIVKLPKIKHDNYEMDILKEGTVNVDPLVVGVISMMAPTMDKEMIQRVRTFSNKMFGQDKEPEGNNQNTEQKGRSLSILRGRTISIKNEDGKQKVRTLSTKSNKSFSVHDSEEHSEALHGEDTLQNQHNKTQIITAHQGMEEKSDLTISEHEMPQQQNYGTGEITKLRKIVGYSAIALALMICCVAAVMNIINAINYFKK